MSVSKASVSKWETGQSYPDITLLPLLAAFFDCSCAPTNGRWLSRRNCSSKCHLSICHSFTQSVD
ncbi:helix-turn-helix transcriptional regulator [Enterococcus gallinarum]|uniref:Helix-turn-helix transcriptional regulator n=2 Tax=Enterococcus gallinarum TaxID=1353 RepID=A0AAE4HN66_ENTGA|nr:helix-turn-helix transcriptional regulator [Enterococcus gallinarum]MDT2688765.1 helix-turn-helix transcriptional regulator [Enterococcus gallinarum]MEB6062743.1 helix-turn-helix domain-containing protein [Enterococcus gallinarum]